MVVCNYYALAPTTEYLRRRYMEFIIWWYVITPPSHLGQSIYGGDIWIIYYGGTNFFAIAPTKEEI